MDRQTYHLRVDGPGTSRVRIALTTYREVAAWGVWSERADVLPANYADSVVSAGGVPVLLPPAPGPEAAGVALDGVHGLVLAGGADVDPLRYGAERAAQTGPPRPDRDAWELSLAAAALDRDMPLLAICRGMQVLNVLLGGDLVQHLPDSTGHDDHQPLVGEHGRHEVRTAPGSLLANTVGPSCVVATYHHQAVDRLGRDLTPTAWAADGTVEAVEARAASWTVGVQWHPESHDGGALFAAFVAACTDYASRVEAAPV